ncbi:MAG: 3D domain-containing protein [Bdellovibrionota bacterium]
MRLPITGLTLMLLFSCGKDSKTQNTPVTVEDPHFKMIAFQADVEQKDMTRIPDLLPTMYYTPKETEVSCAGGYGRTVYRGNEKVQLLTPAGAVIATVCKRYAQTLLMEGSGVLRDRGQGEIAINYGGKVRGQHRYHFLGRCKMGEGIRKDLCLLPYHTIAADNKVHKVDEIIYIPEAKGIQLPDGSIHDGFFIVRDTGGAFNGIGSQRVDLFTGTDPDFDNAFKKAGFHHKRPMDAFKIQGESAEQIREKLREKFGDLY